MKYSGSITDIAGIEVGNYTDKEHKTGCTAVLCKNGAVGGVSVMGSAPGTRETDLLKSENLVDTIHGIMLSGGSAFGLESACGAMDFLRENGYGLNTGFTKIPIVPAAVLYDCNVGSADAYPTKDMGYKACENADKKHLQNGQIGAGTGATVGKALGIQYCQSGGLGTASISGKSELAVGSITAVNALGDIVEKDGTIVKGAYNNGFMNVSESLLGLNETFSLVGSNTTIGILATNARLTKPQANKLASMCHDALAIAIRPSHTINDGDTFFVMSTGEIEADFTVLSTMAVECVRRSIINAVIGEDDD